MTDSNNNNPNDQVLMADGDRYFDQLGEPLKKNIYTSYKGRFRLALLWDDLAHRVQAQQTLLDAGAGLAQISARFAQQDVCVHAFDAAENMKIDAQQHISSTHNGCWGDRYQVQTLQNYQLPSDCPLGFDWVLCHAVLAWLTNPKAALSRMATWVKKGGYLSLLFFNQHSIALKQIHRGRFDYLEKMWLRLDAGSATATQPYYPGGLTPQMPLSPQWVFSELEHLGFDIQLSAGVRCFVDYMHPSVVQTLSEEQLLAIERRYRFQLPYQLMGRYVHIIGKKR